MEITVTTPPTPPVSLENFKLHLSMNDDSADDLLEEYLEAAVEMLMDATGFVPGEAEFVATITDWPTDGEVLIPRRPLVSVDSVKADDQGDETDLDFTAQLSTGKVTITSDEPESFDQITITFTAGNTCPARFKVVTKLLAAHLYANREAFSDVQLAEVPAGFSYVVQQLRGSLGVAHA
jgi:uncharacterized phiE125 gp8 family phage protein